MALLTIQGTLKDSNGNPLPSRNVSLHDSSHTNLDTTLTDSGGNYSVSIDSASNPPGVYHTHFQGEAPHYAAVASATVDWGGGTQTVTRNLVSAFSNNAPQFDESIPDQEDEEDSGVTTLLIDVSDADGDDITPVKIFGPSWVSFTMQGSDLKVVINYDAAQDDPDPYDVAVELEDEFGARSARQEFTVTVNEKNVAPVFDPLSDQTFILGTGPQTFDIHAVDPNAGDTVTYSQFSGKSWATVNPTTGEVTVDTDAALADGAGDYGHTWRASDGELASNVSHTIRMILGGASLLLTPVT